MKDQHIQTRTLDNGLTLVVEPMSDVQSAAFSLLVPAGSIYDPPGQNGCASLLSDLITRGAGSRDTRQLSADLDNLGVQRHESSGSAFLTFTGATLADNIPDSMRLYGDIIQRPHLPADQFEAARSGVEQTLRALEDEPQQKVMHELRRRCYPVPWGLPSEGTLSDLAALSADSIREQYERCFHPNGTILGVAGNVNIEEIQQLVEEIFGDWQPKESPQIELGESGPACDHIEQESAQTHIGLAYESVPYRDPDYYAAWAAVSVLSGGMSSRLFTEVREKKGLCYSIYASLSSFKDQARVLCYSGTNSADAQQTLDVMVKELKRIEEGIETEELQRCQARAKSALVMQQESTVARSSSIARDWYHLGRVKTLSEIRDAIDALTVETVVDFVRRCPARDFTLLTIGPEALEIPVEVPSDPA
ncbi:MAG: insulinase family protein [Planctomycetes bacterium]|nr:insulinase family protein [Planctomycetota bacterium]